jgi:FSR family fosmidomycin resistance protein-like MFS transporter
MMLDIMNGFKVLYLVNVVGLAVEQSSLVLTVSTFVGLIADFMLIYILERVQGIVYLRYTVIAVLCVYPAMLLVDIVPIKIILLVSLGIFLAGWYPILKGNLYNSLAGRSGTALATTNAANMFGSLIPLALGAIADWLGLEVTMWLILISPILLLMLLPRQVNGQKEHADSNEINAG